MLKKLNNTVLVSLDVGIRTKTLSEYFHEGRLHRSVLLLLSREAEYNVSFKLCTINNCVADVSVHSFPSLGELVFFSVFGMELTISLCWQDLNTYWKANKSTMEKEGRLPIITVFHYFLKPFFCNGYGCL